MVTIACLLQGKGPFDEELCFFSKMAADRGISLSCFLDDRGYFGSLWDDNYYYLVIVNEENDCHSHIYEPLFFQPSKTMILKMKVDIHVFSAFEKLFL